MRSAFLSRGRFSCICQSFRGWMTCVRSVYGIQAGHTGSWHREEEVRGKRKRELSYHISRNSPSTCPRIVTRLCSTTVDSRETSKEGEVAITAIRCTLKDVPGAEADLVADTLLGLGAQSASVTEFRPPGAVEQEIFDDGVQTTRGVWNRCTVTAHFPPDQDVQGPIQVIKSAMSLEEIQPEISDIADSDWLDGICASYQPTCIVDDLWIIPSWSDPANPNALNIKVEPGLAFGTGEHPTTRLCLKMIRFLGYDFFKAAHVMDYGTGSGVLALAALKLGATLAVGTDTDSVAVRAARQNGSLNQFQGRWITMQCDPDIQGNDPVRSDPQGFALPTEYDLVVANILQGPLLDLFPRLSSYTKPGCPILLSGIMTTQVAGIQEVYQEQFEDFRAYSDGVWSLVFAIRKAGPSCPLAYDYSNLPDSL